MSAVTIDREVLEAVVRCAQEEICLRRTSPIVLLIERALREDDARDTERAAETLEVSA